MVHRIVSQSGRQSQKDHKMSELHVDAGPRKKRRHQELTSGDGNVSPRPLDVPRALSSKQRLGNRTEQTTSEKTTKKKQKQQKERRTETRHGHEISESVSLDVFWCESRLILLTTNKDPTF